MEAVSRRRGSWLGGMRSIKQQLYIWRHTAWGRGTSAPGRFGLIVITSVLADATGDFVSTSAIARIRAHSSCSLWLAQRFPPHRVTIVTMPAKIAVIYWVCR
jgi:hypothetical protein